MPDTIVTSLVYDNSGVQTAATRIEAANERIVASTDAAASATDRIGAANLRLAETQRQVTASSSGSVSAYDRLKRSIDPAYDATVRIERATRDADAAVRAGRELESGKSATLAALTAQLGAGGAGLRGYAKETEGATFKSRELREEMRLMKDVGEGNLAGLARGGILLANSWGLLGAVMTPIGAAVAVLTGGLVAWAIAQNQLAELQQKLTNALHAGGDAVGLTRDQMEALAQERPPPAT